MRKNGIKSCLNALNQIMVGRLQILFIILVFVSVVRNEGRVNETEAKLEEHIYKKFEEFKAKYNKNYTTIEENNKRYEIFKNNYLSMLEYHHLLVIILKL